MMNDLVWVHKWLEVLQGNNPVHVVKREVHLLAEQDQIVG